MFIRVCIWGDKEAQEGGWDNLEATGYADDINDEQIYMPASEREGEPDADCEDVQGEKFTGVVGSFIHDRLYTGETELIRAADGSVWVDFEAYTEAAL